MNARRSLVSALNLRSILVGVQGQHNVVPVDASYFLPAANRDAKREFVQSRIPGSRFFDVEGEFSVHDAPFPHTLCSRDAFERGVRRMGLSNSSHIVLYDRSASGIFSAARAWWMFVGFGHSKSLLSVLDGGFKAYTADADAPLESGEPAVPAESDYVAQEFDASMLRSFEQVRANEATQSELVIDARAADRFKCVVDEPRVGLRRGTIPGSCNVPFGSVLNADGTFKSDPELRAIFSGLGVDDSKQLVFSCGSGITACVSAFAAHTCGISERIAVYDGSWTEYGTLVPKS
jgi:thiosulfate/3-mercaptopyruvate sulfurtransferase